jgi:uncharacterized protein (TIGR03435 family)
MLPQRSKVLALIAFGLGLACGMVVVFLLLDCPAVARAQTVSPPNATTHNEALAFDVVSIRQNKTGGQRQDEPTPNGYRMINMPIMFPIVAAYVPSSGNELFNPGSVAGVPEWAKEERFDIEAKVAEADIPRWQDMAQRPAMLRAMMQTMLAERFKLAVHREMKEVSMYSLVVSKSSANLKPSVPGGPHPNGRRLPGNSGVMLPDDKNKTILFYETSMATFAPLLSDLTGRPVQDKTGLTGKFDFAIPMSAEMGGGAASPGDAGPTIYSVLGEVGLKLVAVKGAAEMLVIDHMEQASEN